MSYTGTDMVAAAEAHYRAATTFLTGATNSPGASVEWQAMIAATAHAEATAGLLAMELARYAGAGE